MFQAFVKRARQAVLGNGLSATTELGPLVTRSSFDSAGFWGFVKVGVHQNIWNDWSNFNLDWNRYNLIL